MKWGFTICIFANFHLVVQSESTKRFLIDIIYTVNSNEKRTQSTIYNGHPMLLPDHQSQILVPGIIALIIFTRNRSLPCWLVNLGTVIYIMSWNRLDKIKWLMFLANCWLRTLLNLYHVISELTQLPSLIIWKIFIWSFGDYI